MIKYWHLFLEYYQQFLNTLISYNEVYATSIHLPVLTPLDALFHSCHRDFCRALVSFCAEDSQA